MYKIDLHTHSQASPDGSLRAKHYRQMLESGRLDGVAITDHDMIDFARQLYTELGKQIIIGEEISTNDGEIVGLYLKELVPANLSAIETARLIHRQGGLVYIPHPFETVRKGLTEASLEALANEVDIIETLNGRSLQNRSAKAVKWANEHYTAQAASSDAHGWHGWGRTYSAVNKLPDRKNLVNLLQSARYETGSPGIRGYLYPKINRFKHKLRHHA